MEYGAIPTKESYKNVSTYFWEPGALEPKRKEYCASCKVCNMKFVSRSEKMAHTDKDCERELSKRVTRSAAGSPAKARTAQVTKGNNTGKVTTTLPVKKEPEPHASAPTKAFQLHQNLPSTPLSDYTKLPAKALQLIAENLEEDDLFPFAMTCKVFRQMQRDLVNRNKDLVLRTNLARVWQRSSQHNRGTSTDYLQFLWLNCSLEKGWEVGFSALFNLSMVCPWTSLTFLLPCLFR